MMLRNEYRQMHRVLLMQTLQLAMAVIVIVSFGYVSHGQTDLKQTQSSIFPRRSIETFVETYVDRDTADDVRARYEVYAQSHADGWQERWAKASALSQHVADRRDSVDRIIQRRFITSDWNKARRAMFNAFVEDVRAMLESDDAVTAWNGEVRRARIADWLRELDAYSGLLAKHDPFIYLEEVDVPAVLNDHIANLRDVYESNTVTALRRLEKNFDRLADDITKLRMEAEMAALDAGATTEQLHAKGGAVSIGDFLGPDYRRASEESNALRTGVMKRLNELNAKARREIIDLLPEPQRTQYENAWFCGVLPRMCVPSPVELVLEQLLEDGSIDVSLRQTLDALGADYERERIKLRRELMDAFEKWDSPEMEALRAEEEARLIEEGEDSRLARALHPANDVLRKMFEHEQEITIRIERSLTDAGRSPSSFNARVRVLLKWHKVPQ